MASACQRHRAPPSALRRVREAARGEIHVRSLEREYPHAPQSGVEREHHGRLHLEETLKLGPSDPDEKRREMP